MLSNELDNPTLITRRADLRNMKVDRLVSNRAFYVVLDDSTQHLLVVLAPALSEGATGAQFKLLPSQMLMIQGRLNKLPDAKQAAEKWGVRGHEAELLKNASLYLYAEQVTITKQVGTP